MSSGQMGPEHNSPSLQNILDSFESLAARVKVSDGGKLDPFIAIALRRNATELRRFIPGLDRQPDPEMARHLVREAFEALQASDPSEAISTALKGLSCAPHHPGLWFVLGGALFEVGAVDESMCALRQTLWIHPGHSAARRDLDVIARYNEEGWDTKPGEISSSDAFPPKGDDFGPEESVDDGRDDAE